MKRAARLASRLKTVLGPVVTKSGVVFDAALDVWSYRDGVDDISLDFRRLPGVSSEFLESVKSVLAWYAENHSPSHLSNMFWHLKHYLRKIEKRELTAVTSVDLLNYKSLLGSSTHWYLGKLAGFFKRWHKLGYPGVSDDAMQLLKQLRIQGNAKGTAVLTLNPYIGPLTHIELEALQGALHNAYALGALSMERYVLAWLYLLLGQRNKQHAALKVCDVQVSKPDESSIRYLIEMPSAKNRAPSPRAVLVRRPLIEQFGEVLVAYATMVSARFNAMLPNPALAPLFPNMLPTRCAKGFEFHRTASDIGQILTGALESLCVVSERTGQRMNICPTRFRRTIGTRAGEEGLSPLVIARMLDHTDTQQVGVYTANSLAIIDRLDRGMALDMAPLAQAFAGVLVSGEDESSGLSRRIVDLRIDRSGTPMGGCGNHGFCGFNAPIACYTCVSFEAWEEGPHEAVLDYLLSRRERLLKTLDKRMATINDRTIYAVAAVVEACQKVKSLRSQDRGGDDG